MIHVALEWDHAIARPMVRWIVVRCSRVDEKFGGLQAMPPRRDVALFVEGTAEEDAKAFAAYKNGETALLGPGVRLDDVLGGRHRPARHVAFEWDHDLFRPHLKWAVLEWSGDHAVRAPRRDVAYFLDPESAEEDAKVFSVIRDRRLAR